MKRISKRIYLDHAAATPIDKRVSKVIGEMEKRAWGNTSSLHQEGETAKNFLEEARVQIGRILHCRQSEIFFTSGGTESSNLAILGVVSTFRAKGVIPHIITSSIEHPSVLEPIKHLLKKGEIEVSFISPNAEGVVSQGSIEKEIKENTVLICLMHSNNEIGVIQPIRKISSIIKKSHHPYLLVDASQSVCYENISIERLGADILILDGIKMYGPRGVGVLVVRHGVEIGPIIFGGGQERGLRSGTENVAGAVSFARALKICEKTREKESARLKKLRDYALSRILKEIPNSSLNGSLESRLPNNLNICFSGHDSEFFVVKLDTLGFSVSAASACQANSLENSSYVIESLGKKDCANSSLRFTLGRETKKIDIDKLIIALKKILNHPSSFTKKFSSTVRCREEPENT